MADESTTAPVPARRDALARRIRMLVAATITYNVIEAVVALAAGIGASSTALVGFGLDSVIEVSSAAAVAWQFSARAPAVREAREKTTLRIIACSFFALAAYVTLDAVRTLAGGGEADRSLARIVLAALSLAVMPALSLAQRRAGRELGSRPRRRRLPADPAVHLPLRGAAARTGGQCHPRLVVGGSCRLAGDRRRRRLGRPQGLEGRRVLRNPGCRSDSPRHTPRRAARRNAPAAPDPARRDERNTRPPRVRLRAEMRIR